MGEVSPDGHTVLVVGDDQSKIDSLEGIIADRVGSAVEVADSIESATSRLGAGTTIGCVLLADSAGDPAGSCRHLRETDPDVPLVLLTDVPFLSTEVATVSDVRIIEETSDAETIATCLVSALESYDRRSGLRDDATMYRSYLESIRLSMFTKDIDHAFVRRSPAPGGAAPQDDITQAGTQAGWDELSEDIRRDETQVLEKGDPVHSRDRHIETTSGSRWFRTSMAPWRGEDGTRRGLVGMSWDVTDEMMMERYLSEQEASFEEFARTLSHDIRTPLQVARGNLELATADTDVESADEDTPLGKTERALDRISEMIEDLETVAKEQQPSSMQGAASKSGEEAIVRTPIHDVATHLWSVLETGRATLEVEFSEQAFLVVEESALRPVLENLLTNAINHGGEDVTVRLGRIDTGGFYVADDGPGIDPERREMALDDGVTSSPDGRGTGLSIVTGIANANGWEVELTESVSGGVRVEFHNCMVVDAPVDGVPTGERVTIDRSSDVGPVTATGESHYDGQENRWIVRGAGTNIWRRENEFHFAHTSVDDPVRIEAKIVDLDERSQYTKAGLMLRNSLEESSAYGYVGVTPKHGTEVLWRTRADDPGVSQQLGEAALSLPWYRIERQNGVVTTSVSTDGERFHAIDQRSVEFDDTLLAGLVVCSHMPQSLCEATFGSVRVERLEGE